MNWTRVCYLHEGRRLAEMLRGIAASGQSIVARQVPVQYFFPTIRAASPQDLKQTLIYIAMS